jgi:hypothetical protein
MWRQDLAVLCVESDEVGFVSPLKVRKFAAVGVGALHNTIVLAKCGFVCDE